VEELLKNNLGLQVLTDTGWSDFSGLLVRGKKQTLAITTINKKIVCTPDHKFFKPNFEFVAAQELKPRSKIISNLGIDTVVSVKLLNEIDVYDLFEVSKNHRFYANGLLAKNCEFLIFEETLINSMVLAELKGTDPLYKQGQLRWYKKPKAGNTYVIGLDPSLGTGGDNAAIQVLELPACVQVAEWQHNKTTIQRQVALLKEICQTVYDETHDETSIYYSVENNTLGEAALISIAEIGEENIKGAFLSEPPKLGQTRRYRKGYTTTNKSKLAVCAKFKSMLESKKMIISSGNLISELKNFVAQSNTFTAKVGETDDLVMSMLLTIRMVQTLQNFDATLDEKLRSNASDDFVEPMPFILLR
jgi:hypothetical protein